MVLLPWTTKFSDEDLKHEKYLVWVEFPRMYLALRSFDLKIDEALGEVNVTEVEQFISVTSHHIYA